MSGNGAGGCAAAFLECPRGLELGVDLTRWQPRDLDCFAIGELTAGAHYFTWAVGGNHAIKQGTFVWLFPLEVAVFLWDAHQETFIQTFDADEVARFRTAYHSAALLNKTVPMQHHFDEQWARLVSCVSPVLIHLIQAPRDALRVTDPEFANEEDVEAPSDNREAEEHSRYLMEPKWCDLAPPASKSHLAALDPQQRTGCVLDTSQRLHEWVEQYSWKDRMVDRKLSTQERSTLGCIAANAGLTESQCLWIGELQMAFICFLLGEVLSAFEHLKQYYRIVPFADQVYGTPLGTQWIRALQTHLEFVPSDILQSDITKDNFFVHGVIETLEFAHELGQPLAELTNLQKIVREKFGMSWEELAEIQTGRGAVVVDG